MQPYLREDFSSSRCPLKMDEFTDALLAIAKEIQDNPTMFKDAPLTTPVSRLDETRAARHPVLRWRKPADQ
jgi:glycine dehydrogenase subunit 2